MAMYFPRDARGAALTQMISGFALNSLYMHLLKTRVIGADTVTLATLLANEATFAGYVKAQLVNFSAVTVSTGQVAFLSCTATFTPTSSGGTGNIFGTFVTDAAQTLLFAAEDFGATPLSTPATEAFQVTTQWNLGPG